MENDGTYCVVDVDELLNDLGIDIYNLRNDAGREEGAARAYQLGYVNLANDENRISGQADIVFVIDTTGSMEDEINGVERNVKYFAEKLKTDYNVMVNYALIDYKDLEEDGFDSIRILKNNASNWFSNTILFSNKVDTMFADGGGDNPECAVDALETGRRLNFRSGSVKFIILVTDAENKILNRYGIESMEEEADLLQQDGIITSVVTKRDLQSEYQVLLDRTGGIYANIDSDFGDVLLQLADMVGENTASEQWVILKHGYTYIQLPEESDGDFDDDGLSDEYELGEKQTIDLTRFIQLRLEAGGVPFERYAGKTTIEVYNARSNPISDDTDGDGIKDGKDTAPWTKGLKDGVVGGLRICSYSSGPSSLGNISGHAYVAYTSYIADDLILYGMLVDSEENEAHQENIPGSPTYYNIHMDSDDFISIGGWAGFDTMPGYQRGTWINEEKYLFGEDSRSTQYSLTAYITYSDVQKFGGITKKNSKWTELYNCSAYAVDFWNEVTHDNLSARGALYFRNPSSLSNNIKRRRGYCQGGQQKVDWP